MSQDRQSLSAFKAHILVRRTVMARKRQFCGLMMEKKDIRGIKKGAFFGRNEGLLLSRFRRTENTMGFTTVLQ
jgi:hypothetical protein